MTKRIHAIKDDALGTMDAVALSEAIRVRKVSLKEVTEAAIARAEAANKSLNALVLNTYEDAKTAQQSNKEGLLYGVPTFVKDNDHIKGYPTQMGTGVFKAKPAPKNGRFVQQMLGTGLNYLGKTTMPEFGLLCSTENERWGITRNPWNTDYTPGGSSSGSAAMVAAGVVPIAQANDGAGSTRIPAACCGLVGLKPSRGRLISMDGTDAMPIKIVYQGVLTRSVRDTAAFYAAAEQYKQNKKLPPMGYVQDPVKRRLKIAFIENPPEGAAGHMDADTWRVQLETAALLESLGHQVEMIPVPLDIERMIHHYLNYYGFLSFLMTRMSRLVIQAKVDRTSLEPFTYGLSSTFRKNLTSFPKSVRVLKKIIPQKEMEISQIYDVVMSPVTALRTPEIGYFSPNLSEAEVIHRASYYAPYPGMQNVSGSPAISLPLGRDAHDNPLGVQFIAPMGQDQLLLELAYELELAKPWKMIWEA